MEPLLIWGLVLIGAGALLFVVELLVPSGGLLGLLALASATGGCVVMWIVGPWWGIISTGMMLVLVPMAVVFAFRVMPYTPIGRQMFLGGQHAVNPEEALEEARRVREEVEARNALVGTEGEAVTDCHPIGAAILDGQRLEVLSVGGLLESGQRVRVVAVEGNTVKVRGV